ncbi:Metallo-dependent hydrolase [Tilletiaria anomala UBC 951]|uniref:Metallo-dependent hydrolase n=1 Tax=Tilletiaria anomala (strain ATCC 24038 / CBS 436.72 / UBC 951) TaxID=1037660 RepID=A0A066VSF5_TILAU|nr:Metallo-dependent hydrolase [Tilletiaria anomala UBC 951]KDN44371.1 Metallo-dependent hydrolase [Tilletiaria anomala UBC 951]
MAAGSNGRHLLLACGSNAAGQLGLGHCSDAHRLARCRLSRGRDDAENRHDGDDSEHFPPEGWKVQQLASGANHTIALLASSRDPQLKDLWFAGNTSLGQCGPPNINDACKHNFDEGSSAFFKVNWRQWLVEAGHGAAQADTYRPNFVGCGWNSTFIIFVHLREETDDLIVSLGSENDFNELGCGQTGAASRSVLTNTIRFLPIRAAILPELADNSEAFCLRIHSLVSGLRHALCHVSYVKSGGTQTCHKVIGWGAARHGQLSLASPQQDGGSRGASADKPKVQWLPKSILTLCTDGTESISISVAAGKRHSAVLIKRGGKHKLYLCGTAAKEAGDRVAESSILDVSCCWDTTVLLLSKGDGRRVLATGANSKGQLGNGTFNATGLDDALLPVDAITEHIACGSEHVVALLTERNHSRRRVVAWGWNEHGNLGQGDEEDRSLPQPILHDEEGQVTDVWAGCATTFLQVQLNQGDQSDEETVKACRTLPKVELHAHLNGSIRRSTLAELAKAAGLDDKAAHIANNDARTLSQMFAVFDVIHKSVRGKTNIMRVAREVLEDMEADSVAYVEIRTTPKAQPDHGLTEEDYCHAVLEGMEDYASSRARSKKRTVARLLLSIDRRAGRVAAKRCVELALQFRRRGVVGIDLSGDPSKGEWDEWKEALTTAKAAGLRVTLHAGELPDRDQEMQEMLDFRPDRFGHVCFISAENEQRLQELNIPVELCLTSNILSRSVARYDLHHCQSYLQRWQLGREGGGPILTSGPPSRPRFSVCTDDSAVFGSSLSEEYLIIKKTWPVLGMDDFRQFNLMALEDSFIEDGPDKAALLGRLLASA